MSDTATWRKVSSGLRWMFILTLAKVGLAILILVLSAVLFSSVNDEDSLMAAIDIAKVWTVVTLAVEFALLYALLRYSSVPERTEARVTAIGALILGAVAVVFEVLSILPVLTYEMGDSLENRWDLFANLAVLAQFFTLLVSLRTLARYLGITDTARLAGRAIALAGTGIGLVIFTVLVTSVSQAVVFFYVFGAGCLVLLIWSFVLELICLHRLAKRTANESDVAEAFT